MGLKWDDAKPAEKLLALYTILLGSREGHSLSDLADQLSCSKQTVERLIDQIESSCFGKIHSEKIGRESFYRLKRPAATPRICLDASGLRNLAICHEFSQMLLPANMRKKMERSLLQAYTYQDGENKAPYGIGQQLSKGYIDYAPYEEILEALIQAISEGRVCEIVYRKRRGEADKASAFAPKRLLAYHECIYALGWMVAEEGAVRALFEQPQLLAVQRFVDCKLTDRSSKRLPAPKANAAMGVMSGEQFDVTVRFSSAAATYAAERQWSARQKIVNLPDGGIELTFTARNEAECISWLLSFAETARVIGPDWLVEAIRARIMAMAEVYK